MSDDEVLVCVAGVSRRFERGGIAIAALNSVTFNIRRGQRIAIVGSSGSGKSTLLHILAGLDEPSAGQVRWPALGVQSELLPGRISIAFQNQSLVPFLNVAENVALPQLLLGNEIGAASSALSALARFDLGDLAEKLPEELSGGQGQRAALARAITGRPQLLLADEPTGQLDQASARQTILTLTAWAEASSCALVVATHDTAVARSFGEVWRMDHGRIVDFAGLDAS
jgi:putative ABC transport system ATP-binding protein/lipoprotein-releasing system ATP-binding protein